MRTEVNVATPGEFETEFPYEEGYWTGLANVDWLLTPVITYVTNQMVDPPTPGVPSVVPGPNGGSIIMVHVGPNRVAGLIPTTNDDEPTAYAIPDGDGIATFEVPYTTGWSGYVRSLGGNMGKRGDTFTI